MEIADRLALDAAAGSKGAFEKLYKMYFMKIYRYSYYRCLSRAGAEDITSTVFLKAVEKISAYRPEAGEFPAWLFGIARNTLMDYFRERKKDVPLEDIWDVPDGRDVTIDPENRVLWEKVRPFFKKLNPHEREIIILRIWDEVPYSKISALTGRTQAACRMSYMRAIEALREAAIPLSVFLVFLVYRPL